MARDAFCEHVLTQLQGLGRGLRARAMFGGHVLYFGDAFFGIVWRGQLFFKTSPATAERYQQRGSEPFQPSPTQRLKNYYEVPLEVIERADELVAWAREAVDIGG